MSTRLQDFREQYPQYSDMPDEDLAESLRQRYYSDMPIETYRQSMGLPPPAVVPEKPSVWDRVSSLWEKAEQKPAALLDDKPTPRADFEPDETKRAELLEAGTGRPQFTGGRRAPGSELPAISKKAETMQEPRALLRDQLFAGFDEMRANRETIKFLDASQDYQNAEAIATGEQTEGGYPNTGATGSEIDAKIRAARARYGNEDQKREALIGIGSDVEQLRVDQVGRMQQAIDKSLELRTRSATVPYAKETRDMLEADTFQEGISEFMDDPVMIIAETSLRSLPNMAEAIPLAVGGALLAGPWGFAGGIGAGSAMVEYRAGFSQYLQQQGIDLTDARSMVSAGTNDELMRQAHEYAGTRAGVIGAFSAIGGGIATKPLTPFVKNVLGRELSNMGAQVVAQSALEGSGEALAQVATGEDVDPGEVLAEMTGGLLMAPIEVGAASVTGLRSQTQQSRAAKIESEVNQILGRGDHFELPPLDPPIEPIEPIEPAQPPTDTAQSPTEPVGPPAPDPDQVSRGTDEASDQAEIERADVVEYFDQRLKRSNYRAGLQNMADELTPGGGVAYIWTDYHVTGRTPSVNPDWFKGMNQEPEFRMSVNQVQNAVNKAVTGKKLGVREQRVVQMMTDTISDARLENVDYAKQALEEARKRRLERRSAQGMQPDASAESAGEQYREDEYSPEMSADSRIIFELMETATQIGVDEGILEGLAIHIEDNQELMTALEKVIDEQRRTAGTQTDQAQPTTEPEPDATIGDIFGDDTAEAQAIADEIRRRDAQRQEGQESVETGDAGDLFSDARQQVDIDDAVLASRTPKGKKLSTTPGQIWYHGTNTLFDELQRGQGVSVFLTQNKKYASQYGKHVIPAAVDLKNIADLDNDPVARQIAIDEFNDAGGWEQNDDVMEGRDSPDFDPDIDDMYEIASMPYVSEALADAGYDGSIQEEGTASSGSARSLGVFNPANIRRRDDGGDLLSSRSVPPKKVAKAIQDPGDRRATNREALQHERRNRLERMSLEELVDAYYTDPLTGLANRAAFSEESKNHKWLASIDADGLKWINDHLGHDAGDAMLVAIGEALQQTGIDAYHISGDEFYIAGGTKRDVQAALTMAEGILSNQVINSPGGKKVGVEITGAIGKDKASADSMMEAAKKSKKGRAERGSAPKGATLSAKASKVLDMDPGTNYVRMIGNIGSLPIDANFNLVLGTTGRTVRIPKIPVRREHALAIMQKYFGKRIYQGRVKGGMRLGFYRPGHGEVRIKNHNDIEVAAHEIAHFLDDRYPWIARLYKQHSAEVKSVSYDVKLIYEGYAEFMRLWMTQESEAMKQTPAFYDAFNEAAKKQPKLWSMLTDLQELMHAWTMQGARARGASKHGTADAPVSERIRQLFPINLFQRTLDGLRSVKTIAADLADQERPAVVDAYERLRLAIGGSNGVLEAAMFYGTPQWREDGQGLEIGGESLQTIWGNDWGNNDVAMYMIARRAAEIKQQGRENLLRNDEIAAWLKLGDERPELKDKFTRHQAFNQRMLDFAEGGGILNSATRKAFVVMNQNYVPFHRIIESQINGTKVRPGGNPFQRLKGGTQNINNVWDNIVNNTGMIIRMSMVNDGKRAVLSHLGGTDKLGAGKRNQQAGVYAAPIAKEVAPVGIHSDQVLRKVVEAMGLSWRDYTMARDTGMYPAGEAGDYLEGMVQMINDMAAGMDELVTFWKFGQDPKGDNVDFYMTNGDKVFFEINDPNLMDTLRFLGPRGTNLVLAIAGAFSATLRRGVVAVPVFQMKNFMRDSMNAWLLSSNVKVPAVRAMRVVLSRMAKDPAYQDMLINGGGFANRSQGLQAQRKVIVDPTRLTAFYDRFMGRFENANRLAEYKAARGAGESPRRAALLSREISTDFGMRGSSEVVRYLAIAVPFLNARVQGLYRVVRQFDTVEHAGSYALRGLALAGVTMALYAMNKDDDRYKELPEDVKDLYWVFFNGDDEDDYVLFPKPFESGMLWGTIPERMFEYAEQENGKEFADALGWMMLETFNMDMTPQIFQPWQDLHANKKFTGAPIIPHYLENVESSEQYSYYTSEAVRHAAKAMGLSPIKMEHVLRGYLGTLGTYSIAAADAMIRAATDPDDRLFGEDPSRGETWRENILVKALIDPLVNEGPPRRTKYQTDLYDMIREAEKVANTVTLHQKRTMDQLEEYLNDPEKLVQYATNEALSNARSQMSEIRVAIDRIRQDKEMTSDEKRQEIWELTRQRNKVARNAALAIQEAQTQEAERLQAANAQ